METVQNQDPQPTEEKKDSIASRALVATVFGGVLASKVNNIGALMDANNVLKEHNLTVGQKIRSVFTGDLFVKLKEKHDFIKKVENKGTIKAGLKVFKYSVITSVIGGAIGAGLGWTLGGRIKDWKDIIKHPWQSTKLMFGIEKPEQTKEAEKPLYIAQQPPPEPDGSRRWQDYTQNRGQKLHEVGRAS